MRNRARTKHVRLCLALAFSLCCALSSSCISLWHGKDIFYPVPDSSSGYGYTEKSSKPVIEASSELFKGQLLCYDSPSGACVFAIPSYDIKGQFELYYRPPTGPDQFMGVTSRQFVSAGITNNGSYIYYEEKSAAMSQTILSVITLRGDSKQEIVKTPIDVTIPFFIVEGGLIYADASSAIFRRWEDGTTEKLFDLLPGISARKLAYSARDDMVVALCTDSRASGMTILYRVNLAGDRFLWPISSNVSDFTLSEALGKTFYANYTQAGTIQLYEYDHANSQKPFLLTETIASLYASPNGNYIAYTTPVTATNPTPSVWMLSPKTKLKTQLCVNTIPVGAMYWTVDEEGVIYCVNSSVGAAEPTYTTYRQTFRFETTVIEK